jgi:hypothetical protein
LTFWKKDSSGNKYIGHVALYMGKINDKPAIIHTVSGRPYRHWYYHQFYYTGMASTFTGLRRPGSA